MKLIRFFAIVVALGISLNGQNVYATGVSNQSCPLAEKYHNTVLSYWENGLKTGIQTGVETRLASGDIYVLYDVQKQVQNILRMADKCSDTKILSDIAEIFLKSIPYLKQTGSSKSWLCGNKVAKGCPQSLLGKENVLISSQFLSAAIGIVEASLRVPEQNVTPSLSQAQKLFPPIIKEHLLRWGFSSKQFSVDAWGCTNSNKYTHKDFITKKRGKRLGNNLSYCNAITDSDWFIAQTGIGLLNINRIDSKRFPIAGKIGSKKISQQSFEKYLSDILLTIRQRMTWHPWNGQTEGRLVFDYGAWRDHPAYKFGGYTGEYTKNPPASVPAQTWDQSHFSRMVHLLTTINESKAITTEPRFVKQWGKGVTGRIMRNFANQLLYTYAVNRETDVPSLANYTDGMNGWFRLNTDGIAGHPPGSLTMSSLTGGYGFWASCSKYNVGAGSPAIQVMTKKFADTIDLYKTNPNINEETRKEIQSILLTSSEGNTESIFANSTLAYFYSTLFCVE